MEALHIEKRLNYVLDRGMKLKVIISTFFKRS